MNEFIESLLELIEKKTERDKAFADCDGTWGYYGYYQEEELTKAKERFTKALKALITELKG